MLKHDCQRRCCPHCGSEHELPMLDPTLERRLNLPRLQRFILKRARAITFALGESRHLWEELDRALGIYAERRERAYYALGRARRERIEDDC